MKPTQKKGLRSFVFLVFSFLLLQAWTAEASLHTKFEPMKRASIKNFSFYDAHSTKIDGATLVGHPAIVHIWSTLCPPCVNELKSLDEIMHNRSDFKFYAVCINKKDTKEIEALYKKHGVQHLEVYKDMDLSSLKIFQNKGTPATYFVGADGIIHGRVYGTVDWKSQQNEIFLTHFGKGAIQTETPQNTLQKFLSWFKKEPPTH